MSTQTVWPILRYDARAAIRFLLDAFGFEEVMAEATERIGARPNERTDTRTNQRNGHRPRLLATTAGDVELRIPKLRSGTFFPTSSGSTNPRPDVELHLLLEVLTRHADVHACSLRVRSRLPCPPSPPGRAHDGLAATAPLRATDR